MSPKIRFQRGIKESIQGTNALKASAGCSLLKLKPSDRFFFLNKSSLLLILFLCKDTKMVLTWVIFNYFWSRSKLQLRFVYLWAGMHTSTHASSSSAISTCLDAHVNRQVQNCHVFCFRLSTMTRKVQKQWHIIILLKHFGSWWKETQSNFGDFLWGFSQLTEPRRQTDHTFAPDLMN